MTHYAGKAGEVFIGAEVTGIKSWTLDYTVGVVDTTDFADAGVRSILPSVSQWSGSFEGYKDGTAIPLGVSSSCALQLHETQTSSEKWTGTAYITGVHPSVSYDGMVSYAYDFEGTGALVPPTA